MCCIEAPFTDLFQLVQVFEPRSRAAKDQELLQQHQIKTSSVMMYRLKGADLAKHGVSMRQIKFKTERGEGFHLPNLYFNVLEAFAPKTSYMML